MRPSAKLRKSFGQSFLGRAQEDGESGEGTPGSMVGGGGGGVSISDWRQEVWVGFLWLEREPSGDAPL